MKVSITFFRKEVTPTFIFQKANLEVLLGDWAVGLVTKAYLPAVWSMGGP